MKKGIILQARTSSTRLPGKVLRRLPNNLTVLETIVERLKKSKKIDEIIVATSKNKNDDIIENLCLEKKYDVFRGDEHDVLGRFYNTAKSKGLNYVIRCNADCPLIDYKILDKVIETFLAEDCDYCSNILLPSYPVGMHTEVFSFEALEKAFQNASSELEREHVTPYIYRNPEIFKLKNVKYKKNLSNIRLTLDYEEDFRVISKIFKHFKSHDYFSLDDILNFLENNPDVIKINSHFKKEGTV